MSTLKNIIFGLLLLVLGTVIGYRVREKGTFASVLSQPQQLIKLAGTEQPVEYRNVNFQEFWQVWKILEQNYVDPEKIQSEQMVYGAIKGMTASLGDPYTLFLPPTDQKRSAEDLKGSFFGVGIELGYIEGTLAVQSPLVDSPAAKAGIQAKDLILHVKDDKIDKDTAGWSLPEAVDKIRGDKGSKVTLTLFRKENNNNQPFAVTLERGEIVVPSAKIAYEQKNGKKVAHITLSRFGERTNSEMDKIIKDIQSQSPKTDGIILDMRNNPGGFLEGAITVSSEFIAKGTIVTQKGKYTSKDYPALGTARLANYPVVVVVNGGSASAAEITAGALRDNKEAKLIGEKTFGKGSVQDAMQLEDGSGLHVTIAKWLLPKGDWITGTGIPVNVEVKDDLATTQDEVIQKAVDEILK